jgi:hypothetical protein
MASNRRFVHDQLRVQAMGLRLDFDRPAGFCLQVGFLLVTNDAISNAIGGPPLNGLGRLGIAAPRQNDLVGPLGGRVVGPSKDIANASIVPLLKLGLHQSIAGKLRRNVGKDIIAIDVNLYAGMQVRGAQGGRIKVGDR